VIVLVRSVSSWIEDSPAGCSGRDWEGLRGGRQLLSGRYHRSGAPRFQLLRTAKCTPGQAVFKLVKQRFQKSGDVDRDSVKDSQCHMNALLVQNDQGGWIEFEFGSRSTLLKTVVLLWSVGGSVAGIRKSRLIVTFQSNRHEYSLTGFFTLLANDIPIRGNFAFFESGRRLSYDLPAFND
jgi:hypothetical protein